MLGLLSGGYQGTLEGLSKSYADERDAGSWRPAYVMAFDRI